MTFSSLVLTILENFWIWFQYYREFRLKLRLRTQKMDSIQYKFWQIFLCVDSCWITRISWSIYTSVGKRAPYLFFKACLLCAPPLSSTLRSLKEILTCVNISHLHLYKSNKIEGTSELTRLLKVSESKALSKKLVEKNSPETHRRNSLKKTVKKLNR